MQALLATLTGTWTGQGTNHESQPFTASLTIHQINPTAIQLNFTASGTDGTTYHTETILIGPETATSASNNYPGLAQFIVTHPSPDTIILTLGDLTDQTMFRETITLHHPDPTTLHQTYSWALPGDPIQTRSTAALNRST